MKNGAETKLKFKRLQRRLKLPMWGVMGVLEAMWSVVRNNTPEGDIGRMSNEDIAALMDWEDDADELIEALIDAEWLDRDERPDGFRLIVHDWSEHAPNYLKGNLARYGKQFADQVVNGAKDSAKQPASENAENDASDTAENAEFVEKSVPPSLVKSGQAKPSQATTCSNDGGGGDFVGVVDRLVRLGVDRAFDTVEKAQAAGFSVDGINRIADEFERICERERLRPGAIVNRLTMRGGAELPPGRGWPGSKSDASPTTSVVPKPDVNTAEDVRKRRENDEANQQREARFGGILNAFSLDECEKLLNGNTSAVKRLRRTWTATKSRDGIVRPLLLAAMEKRGVNQ